MRSQWNDQEAKQFVDKYAPTAGEDLALRVYSSRLIGRDDTLVLHGGGNTSVKTTVKDILGERVEVLCVKGSGWDLAAIEPKGLPAVDLRALLRLRKVPKMTDEEMVNQIRIRLLDASAPTPSVETFLHAFLPRKFVDHTHADAIMVLTNQPDGQAFVREALGDDVVILPWIFPGFPLAHAVADAYEQNPKCKGIVLEKHGIFSFGDDARTSYEAMVTMVDAAEKFIAARSRDRRSMLLPTSTLLADDAARAALAEVAPIVRGAVALASRPPGGAVKVATRFVMHWRGSDDLRAFTAHGDCARLAALGPLTPDHVIRTKGPYLTLSLEEARDRVKVAQRVLDYEGNYGRYFQANKQRLSKGALMLDPMPRVVLIEGLGLLAFGVNAKAAMVAADIAEHTLRSKAQAEAIGAYTELPPSELFAMEYLVARTGEARQDEATAARRAGGAHHRGRWGDRLRHRARAPRCRGRGRDHRLQRGCVGARTQQAHRQVRRGPHAGGAARRDRRSPGHARVRGGGPPVRRRRHRGAERRRRAREPVGGHGRGPVPPRRRCEPDRRAPHPA